MLNPVSYCCVSLRFATRRFLPFFPYLLPSMEYFLDLADDYVFDNLYAKVLPATSFIPAAVQQASAAANETASAGLKSLLSYVPHPQLPLAESLEGLSAWPRDYMPRQYISLVSRLSSSRRAYQQAADSLVPLLIRSTLWSSSASF